MPGRFLPQRDLDVFQRVNKELIGDLRLGKDGIINQQVVLYKVSVQDTCLVDAEDFDWNTDEFGPDDQQNASFHILRQTLIDLSLVPEIGDVFEWNWAYFEINSINENQLIGGQQDNNWSVTCGTYRVRFSNLNIERIRSI